MAHGIMIQKETIYFFRIRYNPIAVEKKSQHSSAIEQQKDFFFIKNKVTFIWSQLRFCMITHNVCIGKDLCDQA